MLKYPWPGSKCTSSSSVIPLGQQESITGLNSCSFLIAQLLSYFKWTSKVVKKKSFKLYRDLSNRVEDCPYPDSIPFLSPEEEPINNLSLGIHSELSPGIYTCVCTDTHVIEVNDVHKWKHTLLFQNSMWRLYLFRSEHKNGMWFFNGMLRWPFLFWHSIDKNKSVMYIFICICMCAPLWIIYRCEIPWSRGAHI